MGVREKIEKLAICDTPNWDDVVRRDDVLAILDKHLGEFVVEGVLGYRIDPKMKNVGLLMIDGELMEVILGEAGLNESFHTDSPACRIAIYRLSKGG